MRENCTSGTARGALGNWRSYRGGVGIIDVKSLYPEFSTDIAERLRTVLHYASPEKVYINPDCGFGWSWSHMAVGKLHAIVARTQIVRQELTRS